MDTVQLQCGSCGNVMAILAAHLGGQVQCPHCQAVVQTPAPAAAGSTAATRTEPPPYVVERESIFGGAEASEDLFGDGNAPRLELPPQPQPASKAADPTTTIPADGMPQRVGVTDAPTIDAEEMSAEPANPFADAPAARGPSADADLAVARPRPIYDRGTGMMIALIFLVPYAIVMTLFVAYLLMTANRNHPLDVLPDPDAKKGGPRKAWRIDPKSPLTAHQKTPLGQPLHVGDLEVTPVRVSVREGNLVLRLRVKNTSTNWAFNPISDRFLRVVEGPGGTPYTFVESPSVDRLYGGFVEWFKGAPGREKRIDDGELAPGQSEIIEIMTMDKYRGHVEHLLQGGEPFVWRVQLRRGPVEYHGRPVSATTVVGVLVNRKDVADKADGA